MQSFVNFNQRDINIHVGINDTPFSYASVDFPRAAALWILKEGEGEPYLSLSGDPTRTLQYVTVANFRGRQHVINNSSAFEPQRWKEGISYLVNQWSVSDPTFCSTFVSTPTVPTDRTLIISLRTCVIKVTSLCSKSCIEKISITIRQMIQSRICDFWDRSPLYSF